MDKKTFSTGGFYVGIEGGGDLFTNEAIYSLLKTLNLSEEFEGKEYNGEKIKVWRVNYDFIKAFYSSKWKIPLKVNFYIEVDFSLRRWRLFEPATRKRAKQSRIMRYAVNNLHRALSKKP